MAFDGPRLFHVGGNPPADYDYNGAELQLRQTLKEREDLRQHLAQRFELDEFQDLSYKNLKINRYVICIQTVVLFDVSS
jgi:hypothetical protein